MPEARIAELTQKLRAEQQRGEQRPEARALPLATPTMPPVSQQTSEAIEQAARAAVAAAVLPPMDDVTIRPIPPKPSLFPEQSAGSPEPPPAPRAFIPPAPERTGNRPRRMPEIDELPRPAQAELRAKRGEQGEGEHPEKRKVGLLRRLADWALPVPRAIAARYRRAGAIYRADLITEELVDTRTLTAELRSSALDDPRWREIGACVRRFHERGVRHADLNAHNVLLGATRVYVLDFDRGEVRTRGPWEQAVLARLDRSLVKVTEGLPADRFGTRQWAALLDGYRGGSGGS